MPIITLQQRFVQIGTIRIGAQVQAPSGKMRPAALDKFRFTSDRKDLIDKVAGLYGGTPQPFDEPKSMDRWEVFTDVDVLEVLVPPPGPGRSVISQWYEKWSGGGCTHRCDGQEMFKCDGRDMPPGTPCQCYERGYDPTDDDHCSATTRLNVVIPETGAIGVWRLNTNGWNAAEEMLGIAEGVLNIATGLGYGVPCTLSIQHREVRKFEDGKAVVKKFVVPVLSPDLPEPIIRAVAAGTPYDPRGGAQGGLEMPTRGELPSGGVRADRYGTGRIKPKAIDVAVPPTDMPLPGGPLRTEGGGGARVAKAQAAFILGLPDSFRGNDAQDKRHALYALATNRWDAAYGDLDGAAKAQVSTWATKIAAGDITLNVGESGHSLTGPDGDAVAVTKP